MISKNMVWYAAIGVFLLLFIGIYFFPFSLSEAARNAETATSANMPGDSLRSGFTFLRAAKTNFCAGPQVIEGKSDDERLQGSCCSKMDLHRYTEQVEGLKKYAHLAQIPQDPYDIPVSLAKELLAYQKDIQLNGEQQKIYDDAKAMSHEGGPCCCKCWRYYAFEGQAKYLIVHHGFSAEQIADVWGLEDGCGGPGHMPGDKESGHGMM